MNVFRRSGIILGVLAAMIAGTRHDGWAAPDAGPILLADSGGPPPIERLPPQQQEQVRKNYQKFKNLPPEERERIQKNFREWQQLPPEERRRLQKEFEEINPQKQPGSANPSR